MSARFRKFPFVAALALAGAPAAAQAQLVLEEVIVTAQKRAESLQDVPISVSTLQAEKLQNAGIPNMAALADHVPNLLISDAPVSTNIYMRGMGSSNNQAFEQSVGMYIDGVYMGRGRQYRAPFMDIERVEVLRGPQGTLFGKNTVAGAVSVITASPGLDEELGGRLSLSLESYDGRIGEGVLSGALSDTFALRGALKYRETGGYMDNNFLGQEEPGIEETVYRISALWAPNDQFDASFKWGQSDYERTGVPSAVVHYPSQEERDRLYPNRSAFATIGYNIMDCFYTRADCPYPRIDNSANQFDFFAEANDKEFANFKDNNYGPEPGGNGPNPGGAAAVGKNPESSENETDNGALTLNYDMGGHTFTSVTGYSAYRYVDGCDCDWLPLQFIARDDDQEFAQWSQELRVASPTGGLFDYIAGLYYEESELEFDRQVVIDTNFGGLTQRALGVNSLLPLLTRGQYRANQLGRNHYFKQDADSLALFAQGTFNLAEDWRMTLGLRYTEETKEVVSRQFISDDLTGIDRPTDSFFAHQLEARYFNTYHYDYAEERETDQWLPMANAQWDASEDSMLYATWSRGFKSGGFTGADDGEPGGVTQATWSCEPPPPGQEWTPPERWTPGERCYYDVTVPNEDFEYDDEEVEAFEVGGKHTLLGGAMTFNWAAYYTEYDDLQTSIFKGVSFGVTNAAAAEIKGLELDLLWQASERLRLGANGAWLDAEFTDYATAPCTALQLDADSKCGTGEEGATDNDLSGKSTPFGPEWSASVFFDYGHPLANGMEVFLGGEANASDEYFTQGDLDPADTTDSFAKLNLRIGLRGANEDWELMLYGRNITDEEVYAYSYDIPVLAGTHGAMVDEGAVYGASLRYNWQ